jgi:hypothetical protein
MCVNVKESLWCRGEVSPYEDDQVTNGTPAWNLPLNERHSTFQGNVHTEFLWTGSGWLLEGGLEGGLKESPYHKAEANRTSTSAFAPQSIPFFKIWWIISASSTSST